jgi:hypothetical protein
VLTIAGVALVTTTVATIALAPSATADSTGWAPAVELRKTATFAKQDRAWSYGWPVKPFDRQHPVRGFFGDPRTSEAFHFGIDISAPDGTLVYAIEAGTVYFNNARAIAVLAPDRSHSFGYWHIVPAVKSHQQVRKGQVLGKIAAGWEHVHFAERRGDTYVNPLRPGGIGPYVDRTAPTVASIRLTPTRVTAVVADTPDPKVPGAWGGKSVTPALVRWRTRADVPWQTAADFRTALPDRSLFRRVYSPSTCQNHKYEAGRFDIILTSGQAAKVVSRSGLSLQVEVSDTAGNRSVIWVRVVESL